MGLLQKIDGPRDLDGTSAEEIAGAEPAIPSEAQSALPSEAGEPRGRG